MEGKYPTEILREKYVPLSDFYALYGIEVKIVERLVKKKKIPYAEFYAPGAKRRSPHVNPEDVFKALNIEY